MAFSVSKLCKDSHECALSKGWLDTPRSSCDSVNLLVSELSEALEDYRANKGISEIWYEVKTSDGTVTRMTKDEVRAAEVPVANAKPCGIPVELADFVIRLGQYCGTTQLDLEYWTKQGARTFVPTLVAKMEYPEGFDELLACLTYLSSSALAHPKRVLEIELLGRALALALDYCNLHGIPLLECVEEKHAYNLTRSHRHGGKKI